MVNTIISTARSYSPMHVISHLMLWSVFGSMVIKFVNAYQSVNGAGHLHIVLLVVGIMGLTAQATTLIYEIIEELS